MKAFYTIEEFRQEVINVISELTIFSLVAKRTALILNDPNFSEDALMDNLCDSVWEGCFDHIFGDASVEFVPEVVKLGVKLVSP